MVLFVKLTDQYWISYKSTVRVKTNSLEFDIKIFYKVLISEKHKPTQQFNLIYFIENGLILPTHFCEPFKSIFCNHNI